MSEDDIWRGAPHDSEAPYAHAKRAMLAQLETYQRHDGLDFAYAVSTNLYGPHDRFDEQWGHAFYLLVSKFHRVVTTGEPVVVWGTGTPTRDLLFSRDAAQRPPHDGGVRERRLQPGDRPIAHDPRGRERAGRHLRRCAA